MPDRQARACQGHRPLVDLCFERRSIRSRLRAQTVRRCFYEMQFVRTETTTRSTADSYGTRQLDACPGNVSAGSTCADLCLDDYTHRCLESSRRSAGTSLPRSPPARRENVLSAVAARNGQSRSQSRYGPPRVDRRNNHVEGRRARASPFAFKELTKEPAPARRRRPLRNQPPHRSPPRAAPAAPSGTVAAPTGGAAAPQRVRVPPRHRRGRRHRGSRCPNGAGCVAGPCVCCTGSYRDNLSGPPGDGQPGAH